MPNPHYRVRHVPNQLTLEKHIISSEGRERPLGSGVVSHSDEARNEAALAILGDHLRGDFPRAWRLVDAFERSFCPVTSPSARSMPAPSSSGCSGGSATAVRSAPSTDMRPPDRSPLESPPIRGNRRVECGNAAAQFERSGGKL